MRPTSQTPANGRGETDVERRKAARYVLRVPVLFSRDDTSAQADGFTRDISAAAAYVLCEEGHCPGPGDAIAIQVILPPIANVEAQGMMLNCKGHVIRTRDFQESGFAVLAEDGGMELNTGSKVSNEELR